MKVYILLFSLVNGIIGGVINQPNYGNCEVWSPLIKSTGLDIGTDCCNTEGFKCQDSKVISIDITVDSGVIDLTKLPLDINLEKFSIKGDIYQGEFPIHLLNSEMYKILDLSNSFIKEIPEDIKENNAIEEIYLNNNKIEEFPSQFTKIHNLKVLNLDNNYISGTLSSYCEYFEIIENLSLKGNEHIDSIFYPENVKDFCNDGYYSFDYSGQFSDDEDGEEVVFMLFIVGFIFFIPSAIMLSSFCDDSSHEAYLDLRNQSLAQRQNYEFLPDYNDVIADTQLGLPIYDTQEDYTLPQNIPIIDSQQDLPNYGSQQDLPPPTYHSQPDLPSYEEIINQTYME